MLKEGGALICEADGVVAGCLFYAPKAGYLYVGRLAVVPEYRRRGIGDLLLQVAQRRAGVLGLPRVRLALAKIRAYYEARGYVPIAYHSQAGYTEATYVEMEKALDHHAPADWGAIMAASAVTTLPTLLLFLPLQRRLASGLAAGAVKQ